MIGINPVLDPILLVLLALALLTGIFFQAKSAEKFLWFAFIRRSLIALLLVATMFRPVEFGAETETEKITQQLDIYLVVDTTGSIAAQDINAEQTRLDLIKADIRELVKQYPGARFALISFDKVAVQRIPLSTDLAAVLSAVEVMTPEITLYSGGSSISVAKELLANRLQAAADLNPERSRAVFYFGDGEQTIEQAPESFADLASFISGGAVLGYGTTAGGPMLEQHGFYYDVEERGRDWIEDRSDYPYKQAISRIDENNLKKIAGELSVSYFHRELATPVPEIPLKANEEITVDSTTTRTHVEYYWIFALAMLPLIALEFAVMLWAMVQNQRLLKRVKQ